MYDLIILGGGPGGYPAAIRASQYGLKVAIIEREEFGGVCTNKGCIPTKTILESAKLFHKIKDAEKFGIKVEGATFSLESIIKRKERVVTRLVKGIEYLLKKNNVLIFKDEGAFFDKNKIHLKNSNQILEAKNIILATGSSPVRFSPFNLDSIWTSDDIFSLQSLPEKLLIVGGGVIGVEIATFFNFLGVDTTIFELMPQILPLEDEDIALTLKNILLKRGIKIKTGISSKEVLKTQSGFLVKYEEDKNLKEEEFSNILLSVGRKPNIDESFKTSGIEIEKNAIKVDEFLRTNIENIFAIGDLNGKYMLAHKATKEGLTAVENIKGNFKKMDYSVIPSVIFTEPQIASVGLKEKELKEKNISYKVGKFPVAASGRARTAEEQDGFVKVLISEDKEILGASMMISNATDMIEELGVSIKNKIKIDSLIDTIHPHPTYSEAIQEALENAEGLSIHI